MDFTKLSAERIRELALTSVAIAIGIITVGTVYFKHLKPRLDRKRAKIEKVQRVAQVEKEALKARQLRENGREKANLRQNGVERRGKWWRWVMENNQMKLKFASLDLTTSFEAMMQPIPNFLAEFPGHDGMQGRCLRLTVLESPNLPQKLYLKAAFKDIDTQDEAIVLTQFNPGTTTPEFEELVLSIETAREPQTVVPGFFIGYKRGSSKPSGFSMSGERRERLKLAGLFSAELVGATLGQTGSMVSPVPGVRTIHKSEPQPAVRTIRRGALGATPQAAPPGRLLLK